MPPRRSQFLPVPKKMATKTGGTLKEKTDQWRRIVRTDPARVVRVLSAAGEEPTTVDGDSWIDGFPATLMVMEAARADDRVGSKATREWDGLVEVGIAEVLCQLVIGSRLHPDTPKEGLALATKSAFHWPFEALSNACIHIQRPPTETDRRLIGALKEHWPEMMERLWDDPDQSLLNSEEHEVERLVVAQTAVQIFQIDPTFLSILYDPKDLTIPVVARHWTYATGIYDTKMSAQLLRMFLAPSHPLHVAYVRRSPPPPPSTLLARISLGAGPFDSLSTTTQASALISTLASHLGRLTDDDLPMEFELFFALMAASKECDSDELIHALRTSAAFWKSAFAVLKRPQPPRAAPPQRGPPPTVAVIGTAVAVLYKAQTETPREREPFIRIWLDMGLFNALDNAVPTLIQYPGTTMQLTRICAGIQDAVRDASPGLKKLLRAQFPRWQLIGLLIQHDVERQAEEKQKPDYAPPAPTKTPARDAQMWDQMCWQALLHLQLIEFDWTLCARRGCGKEGTIKCANCNEVNYCGQDCQKKDFKEHKTCCIHMVFVRAIATGQFSVAQMGDEGETARVGWQLAEEQPSSQASLEELS